MFYFKDDNQITVYFIDGNSAVWKKDNPQFERVFQLCQVNQWIEIQMLHNKTKVILNSDVSIQDNKLVIKADSSDRSFSLDLETDNSDPLISFIKLLKEKGTIDTEIERIKPFLINMFQNPYINAVEEIYEYCLAKDFEITEDGCLLAYKNVNADYSSIYDGGKTKHAIGEYTKVKNFDTNRNTSCSYGLHFCSKSYLLKYPGDATIIVKVNPKDIVSIPNDYDFSKGRCKRYMMVGVLGKDGELRTTNIEGEKVVKTKTQTKLDKKIGEKKDRIDETVHLMRIYNNNRKKVANQMGITESTVRRNIQKHNARSK